MVPISNLQSALNQSLAKMLQPKPQRRTVKNMTEIVQRAMAPTNPQLIGVALLSNN